MDAISCIIAVRSADFAYTRPIILTRTAPFVNCFFRIFHKIFKEFLFNRENFLFLLHFAKRAGENRLLLYIIYYNI